MQHDQGEEQRGSDHREATIATFATARAWIREASIRNPFDSPPEVPYLKLRCVAWAWRDAHGRAWLVAAAVALAVPAAASAEVAELSLYGGTLEIKASDEVDVARGRRRPQGRRRQRPRRRPETATPCKGGGHRYQRGPAREARWTGRRRPRRRGRVVRRRRRRSLRGRRATRATTRWTAVTPPTCSRASTATTRSTAARAGRPARRPRRRHALRQGRQGPPRRRPRQGPRRRRGRQGPLRRRRKGQGGVRLAHSGGLRYSPPTDDDPAAQARPCFSFCSPLGGINRRAAR